MDREFARQILNAADKGSTEPRLIYADWLTDKGRDREAAWQRTLAKINADLAVILDVHKQAACDRYALQLTCPVDALIGKCALVGRLTCLFRDVGVGHHGAIADMADLLAAFGHAAPNFYTGLVGKQLRASGVRLKMRHGFIEWVTERAYRLTPERPEEKESGNS